MTFTIPDRLSLTLQEVLDLELSYAGLTGRPNPWWPQNEETDADCHAFQMFCLGLRKRGDLSLPGINIDNFLAHTPWPRIELEDLRPGDLLYQGWVPAHVDERGDVIRYSPHPTHTGILYSPIKGSGPGALVTSIEANTGPFPGVNTPIGAYRKTRELGSNGWLLFGVRPPYADAAARATPKSIAEYRRKATWLNGRLPAGCLPSSTGDVDRHRGDGVPGPRYWLNVQTWGAEHDEHGRTVPRAHALYGPHFEVDSIPGPRTRYVDRIIGTFAGVR